MVSKFVKDYFAKTKAEKGKTEASLPLTLSFRYKNVERLAAEEYEKERVRASRTRPDLNLTFEPTEAWPSSSRSSTPSSFASQEDNEADLEVRTTAIPFTPAETGMTTEND